MVNENTFQKVLDHINYEGEPTEENVIAAFLDMVDCGQFRGIMDIEEAELELETGNITIEDICYNLLKL